jgi:hypothetical protein
MQLKATIRAAFAIFLIGMAVTYFAYGYEAFLWFSVGAGLALVNVFFACWTVSNGLQNLQKKGIFLGLLLLKSSSFLVIVACILMFLKPLLLPFTLGLSIVIFASIGVALWESRRYLKIRQTSKEF